MPSLMVLDGRTCSINSDNLISIGLRNWRIPGIKGVIKVKTKKDQWVLSSGNTCKGCGECLLGKICRNCAESKRLEKNHKRADESLKLERINTQVNKANKEAYATHLVLVSKINKDELVVWKRIAGALEKIVGKMK